jgi:hypothetical protein
MSVQENYPLADWNILPSQTPEARAKSVARYAGTLHGRMMMEHHNWRRHKRRPEPSCYDCINDRKTYERIAVNEIAAAFRNIVGLPQPKRRGFQ